MINQNDTGPPPEWMASVPAGNRNQLGGSKKITTPSNHPPQPTPSQAPGQSADERYQSSLLIRPAPTDFFSKFRHLGPGFILTAAIVGSGELIATTALGAKAGFITFWVILVSCLMKVALQLEFGKNAIYTGLPTMQSLNQLSGPRLGRAHWTLWFWLALQGMKMLQVGGIVGGVAIVLNMAFPTISISWWSVLSAASAALLVFRGQYGWVEKGSLVMIILFTGLILLSLLLLQQTDHPILIFLLSLYNLVLILNIQTEHIVQETRLHKIF